jgi:hypothetical protein
MQKRFTPILISVLALAGITYLWSSSNQPETQGVATEDAFVAPTVVSAHAPDVLPLANSPLKASITSAGDYLIRQQLENGELAYQVNLLTNDRSSTPSYIRLMGGTSALYTVCRVADDTLYCEAADRALEHYLPNLLTAPEHFKGTCLYTNGACPLGGATVTVDAIYKRWLASGSVILNDHDLLATAVDLGYFIVSMRRPEGGFYHSFDPHFAGTVDPNYFDPTFNGEAVAALLQLYEMTGNEFWLEQAREVNDFMLTQTVTEDYGHGYALALFARLDELGKTDQEYAKQIADLIIAGQIRSLNPVNSSIATATKLEALSALAQALTVSDADHEWLDREIKTFITFVQARQFPANDCNFVLTKDMLARYTGGLFGSCEDPSIRVDGAQHWVNGLTLYLEYEGMKK